MGKIIHLLLNEALTELQEEAYNCAEEEGFLDEKYSYAHWTMLIVCEVAHVIEADRKGRHAQLRQYNFESFCMPYKFKPDLFEREIKDTVEDYLAEVCIRILDFMKLEHIDIDTDTDIEERYREYIVYEDDNSLVQNCFDIVDCLISAGSLIAVEENLNCVLNKIIAWCLHRRIDIFRHIDLRIEYNKTRERLHGKRY